VVSYAIPVLFSQHLQAAYRVTDEPDPLLDFSNADGRERLRRAMVVLTAETIFGPVAFNEYQRNIGRGSAGTQWLPDSSTANGGSVNRLVSPSLQAEESTVIPAFSALPCSAGSYVNASAWAEGGSVLASGCEFCPVDTFAPEPTSSFQCKTCPENTNTNGLSGSETCFLYEDNLLSTGILAFGYATTGLSWALALGFLIWLFKHRNDPVVKVSQVEFLVLICLGTIICSSTVIALTRQAGTDEDTSAATAGCMAAPFLYTIGWILQYSSLSAKTYRLYHTMQCTKRMQRVSITAAQMIPIVVVCLLIDVTIVTVWTIMSPLEVSTSLSALLIVYCD
jgi:7 transmembrane sweet-taste receptor of 3 GCPR